MGSVAFHDDPKSLPIPDRRGIGSPFGRVLPLAHVAMERRPRPVANPLDESMFLRVPVNVVDAALEIGLIATRMFPKPTLPNAALATFAPRGRCRSFGAAAPQISASEVFFDLLPTRRVVGVAGRQRPNAVGVIGHERPSDDVERTLRADFFNRLAQKSASAVVDQDWATTLSHDGKEKRPAWDIIATIAGH